MMDKIIVLFCLLAMVAGNEWVWNGKDWVWAGEKDTKSVGDGYNSYGQNLGQSQSGGQMLPGKYTPDESSEGSGDYDDDEDFGGDYGDVYNYDDEKDSRPYITTPSPRNKYSGPKTWSSDDEDFDEGSGDSDDSIIIKEEEHDPVDNRDSYIYDDKKESETFYDKEDDNDLDDIENNVIYDDKNSDIYVESTYKPNGNNNWIPAKEDKESDLDLYVESTNSDDDNTDDTFDDYNPVSTDNKDVNKEISINPETDDIDDYNPVPTDNKDIYKEVPINHYTDDSDDDTIDHEVVHTDNKGVYNEVPSKPMVPDTPQSTSAPPSNPEKEPTAPHNPPSIFAMPGILAAIIGGAVVGLLCAILLVMFIVFRMRKKDEGSYALDEPKRSHNSNSYSKPPSREFYA